ncbi:Rhamnogalacturonate lyase [Arachis hypogaea]|nr:Rhamnogalacturonate lyase [Arachis hypogaea]
MAVADNRQRFMPLPEDRSPGRGKVLVPPEAVLLADPVEPEFQGEVLIFSKEVLKYNKSRIQKKLLK